MRIKELLESMAADLERSDNEAFLLAEHDEACLERVIAACVSAADILREAAVEVDEYEPREEMNVLDEAGIENVANLATVLDESGDPELQKQASTLDQLLLTICANSSDIKARKDREEGRWDEISKKYKKTKEELDELNKISDVKKEIKNSGLTEEYRVLEAPLKTRYCPDHAGSMMQRISDEIYQCPMDGKQFDFAAGYKLESGKNVPGSSVAEQITNQGVEEVPAWDTRDGRLQRNQ